MIFLNEIIEYDITTKEPARFFKKSYSNSNYRQNTLPINLDDDKYRTSERCSFFTRSELRCKPQENTACVFFTWTSLKV